jgi:hypothetical protein
MLIIGIIASYEITPVSLWHITNIDEAQFTMCDSFFFFLKDES